MSEDSYMAYKMLGYAVVSQLCEDYHKAWQLGDKVAIDYIEWIMLYPNNTERLTNNEQAGKDILKLLKEACRKRYGRFRRIKKNYGKVGY